MPLNAGEAAKSKIVELDYLLLKAQPELSLISLYWKRQVNNSELRTGFYTAIEVAESYGCTLWLGDARNTTMLDIAAQDYLVKDLVSMITKSGIRKIARLVTPEEAVIENSFSMKLKIEAEYEANIGFETNIFTSEAEAKQWLFSNVIV